MRPDRRSVGRTAGRLSWPGALAVCWLVAPAARAEASAPATLPATRTVAVLPPRCAREGLRFEPFLDSLRVELAGRGFACCTVAEAEGWPPPDASVHLEVEAVPCAEEAARVYVSVAAAGGGRAASREVSLLDVLPPARPRALALAVAEMLRSLGSAAPVEKAAAPLAAAPPAAPPLSLSPPPPEPARPLAWALGLEAEGRGFPGRDTLLWGVRARFTAGWSWLHAGVDVGGGCARADVAEGDVLLRAAGVGLELGPRFAGRAAVVDLGLRADLGWAWARGETGLASVRTGAGSDWLASAGLRLSVEAPARARVRPRVAIEGGGVLAGVQAQANGQTVAGITGYYLLAAFGVTITL